MQEGSRGTLSPIQQSPLVQNSPGSAAPGSLQPQTSQISDQTTLQKTQQILNESTQLQSLIENPQVTRYYSNYILKYLCILMTRRKIRIRAHFFEGSIFLSSIFLRCNISKNEGI